MNWGRSFEQVIWIVQNSYPYFVGKSLILSGFLPRSPLQALVGHTCPKKAKSDVEKCKMTTFELHVQISLHPFRYHNR